MRFLVPFVATFSWNIPLIIALLGIPLFHPKIFDFYLHPYLFTTVAFNPCQFTLINFYKRRAIKLLKYPLGHTSADRGLDMKPCIGLSAYDKTCLECRLLIGGMKLRMVELIEDLNDIEMNRGGKKWNRLIYPWPECNAISWLTEVMYNNGASY